MVSARVAGMFAIAVFFVSTPIPALAETVGPDQVVVRFRGVSPAVRQLQPAVPSSSPKRWLGDLDRDSVRVSVVVDEHGIRYGTGRQKFDDPLTSRLHTDGEPVAPGLDVEFDGLESTITGPPDTEGAVGPDHYFQVVNIEMQIFEKQGVPLTDPVATNSLWTDTGSVCEGDLYADPVVMYDESADRWVVSYIALDLKSGFLWACVAVSTDGDPAGEYFLYDFEAPRIPDYPKLGVWPDPVHNAYVMGTIPIPNPQGKHDVYALDRERLLMGVEPRPAQRFAGFPNLMMPADVDGPSPPPGSPALLYTFRDGGESFFRPPSPVDSLDVYELSLDWDNPTATRLVLAQSLVPPELAEFNWTICGWNDPDCLEQPGTSQKLDSISWIPMQRLQYRHLGAYETLVGVWTVNAVGEGKHAAPRWFELRRFGDGVWQLAHQGTFAPNPSHRWMASAALDGSGNMALGYSIMNADLGIRPSLAYTVRPVNEPSFYQERWMVFGTGHQTGTNRWGDYASMEVDPADDCTFWFTGEYMKTTGVATWNTRIGAFRVPGCTGTLAAAAAVDPIGTVHDDGPETEQ